MEGPSALKPVSPSHPTAVRAHLRLPPPGWPSITVHTVLQLLKKFRDTEHGSTGKTISGIDEAPRPKEVNLIFLNFIILFKRVASNPGGTWVPAQRMTKEPFLFYTQNLRMLSALHE